MVYLNLFLFRFKQSRKKPIYIRLTMLVGFNIIFNILRETFLPKNVDLGFSMVSLKKWHLPFLFKSLVPFFSLYAVFSSKGQKKSLASHLSQNLCQSPMTFNYNVDLISSIASILKILNPHKQCYLDGIGSRK